MISSIVKSIFKIICEIFLALCECWYIVKWSIELANGYNDGLVISIVVFSICAICLVIFAILNIKALKEFCDIADRKILEDKENDKCNC